MLSITKKIIMAAILTTACTTFAQSKDFRNGSSEVRVSAGGHGLAGNYMLEYERRAANQGLSVFGVFSSRRDMSNLIAKSPEQWMLGVGAPIHLVDNTDFDVFIAPEVALMYVKDNLADNSNVTTFGPGVKIGTMYAFNPTWSMGFEFATYTNWFSDKVAANQSNANLALGFRW